MFENRIMVRMESLFAMVTFISVKYIINWPGVACSKFLLLLNFY